ncbi:hypothetical protein P7K49_015274 [Saguinus oedipus]|uniref:Elongation factor 1-delta n=1 Tax=Saguinus oedipus TaxID=9490 RepID=A0ABQ9V9A6_SAGOE|nr:hypothetical protein P7K49_015274 [Saguinus oedipus]
MGCSGVTGRVPPCPHRGKTGDNAIRNDKNEEKTNPKHLIPAQHPGRLRGGTGLSAEIGEYLSHTEALAKKPATPSEDGEDDDIDLSGSNCEEEKEAVPEAKSSTLLDIKPWDSEMDVAQPEPCAHSAQLDELVRGSSQLVPMGCGIQKLQVQCVVKDDKGGTDLLEEDITEFEVHVQSVDIAAFNKI